MTRTDVAIVGGGISGLATAFYLKRLGIRSILLEKENRLGGLIRTDHIEGCDLEAGPDSFISTKPAVAELAEDLQIENDLIGSNDEKRQIFIVRNGVLTPMPKGMVMMIPTDWGSTLRSPLFSDKTKGRFVLETYFRPRERSGDFSIRDFVLDHFDEESLAYATEPLLAGVYGGDAAQLSARSVLPRLVEYEQKSGSLIKAAQREQNGAVRKQSLFQSFRGGMQTLVERLRESLGMDQLCLHAEVEKVTLGQNCWYIQTQSETIEAAEVVLTCPAYASSQLVAELDPALASELAAVPYSSAILVTLIYRRESLRHPLNGFGFLVPHPERGTIAAATWINTKFPSRIAPEFVGIRAFIVHPEADTLLFKPQAEIVSSVQADLRRFMGFTSDPVDFRVYPWPRSMPQYVVGHAERCGRIRSLLEKWSGLQLASNYFDGVGIPDCIRLAQKTAHQLQQTLCINRLF
jgi:oxygen-dependent protoporphyrinogen oxidase